MKKIKIFAAAVALAVSAFAGAYAMDTADQVHIKNTSKCTRCDGTGEVRITKICGACGYSQNPGCEKCNYTGKIVETHPCSACDGTGKVTRQIR